MYNYSDVDIFRMNLHSPFSSAVLGEELARLGGPGEQGGDLESSGSTTGDTDPLDESPEPGPGPHSGRGSGPSNCFDTN